MSGPSTAPRIARTGTLLAVIAVLVGCNRSEIPLVSVSGKVSFDGGECPAAGSVTFQPVEIAQEFPKRPATGQFGTDGSFSVNSFSNQEGVVPGRYRVEVTCFSGAPDFSKSDPWGEVNFIADSYRPAEITINAEAGPLRYDVDVPRRQKSLR